MNKLKKEALSSFLNLPKAWKLFVDYDFIVEGLGPVELILNLLRLCCNWLTANLGNLRLGLFQPLLGSLNGVIVIFVLSANIQESIGKQVCTSKQVMVGSTHMVDLLLHLRLRQLQVVLSQLATELIEGCNVVLRSEY